MLSLCRQCGHTFAVIDIGSQQLGHCCMTISRKAGQLPNAPLSKHKLVSRRAKIFMQWHRRSRHLA
jgi:hypothetical protein